MRFQKWLIILMMFNSIAYSQITGIPTETKQEIVKTLLDYPLVLNELDIQKQVNNTLNEVIEKEREKISIYESILENKELEIENYKAQKKEYEKQLKRSESGFYLYGKAPISSQNFTPELGVQFNIRNKMFVGVGGQYNNVNNNLNIVATIGVKLF